MTKWYLKHIITLVSRVLFQQPNCSYVSLCWSQIKLVALATTVVYLAILNRIYIVFEAYQEYG